ncbi:MAG TPA: ABC transporter permease subunit [Rhodospirillaceae bacterium]|nr:ABC transporter permease subunit [Rhodospirillaceae bacterium]
MWGSAPLLAMLAAWQLAAMALADPMLPSPTSVGALLVREALHGPLLYHLAATLGRVAVCFTLAMALGTVIGFAMGASERTNHWLDPWLQLFLNLPAMVVAILAFIWLGLGETAAIVAVTASKLPNVVVILREGTRQRSRDLAEMARAFRFSRKSLLLHLVLPELAPYLLAAMRSGLALVWKIVLLVELLGRSSGIGFQMHVYFQLLDITYILAYAVSFMAVMQCVDSFLLRWMERHVGRWQR